MKVQIDSSVNIDLQYADTPKDIVKAFRAAMYEQREHLDQTVSYQQETYMLNCVKSGDVEELVEFMKKIFGMNRFVGKLSKDPLRQIQYTFISAITLITRSAIEGGLPEIEAYNLSDVYIQKMDGLTNMDEIYTTLFIAACDFTKQVRQSKSHSKSYSYPVSLCMEYINNHLHYPITLKELAKVCNRSTQYLSALFKKETGHTLTDYIMNEKLKTAKQMLEYSDFSLSDIANNLAFCSHSNFSEHFRKRYGITPREYRNGGKR